MKIKEVYLFTNRTLLIFDELGEQRSDLQFKISWTKTPDYSEHKDHAVLAEIIADKPSVYIARWQEWKNEITIDELCCLLGHGPWYWDKYKAPDRDSKDEEL